MSDQRKSMACRRSWRQRTGFHAVLSHFDDNEQVPQSYRQSYFALLAANFGPMVAAVKGEIRGTR